MAAAPPVRRPHLVVAEPSVHKPELLGYVAHCRNRVAMLDELTEDRATLTLPAAHRHHPMTYIVLVGSLPLHVVEHAAQIRQFLTAAGVRVRPCPAIAGTWDEAVANHLWVSYASTVA